jgi:hypothetical protein
MGELYNINIAIYRRDYHNRRFAGVGGWPSDGRRSDAAEGDGHGDYRLTGWAPAVRNCRSHPENGAGPEEILEIPIVSLRARHRKAR